MPFCLVAITVVEGGRSKGQRFSTTQCVARMTYLPQIHQAHGYSPTLPIKGQTRSVILELGRITSSRPARATECVQSLPGQLRKNPLLCPAHLINTASRGQGGQSFHFRMDWGGKGPVHKEQGGSPQSVGVQPGTQRQQVVQALADCLSPDGRGDQACISYPTFTPEAVPQHHTALTALLGAFSASPPSCTTSWQS